MALKETLKRANINDRWQHESSEHISTSPDGLRLIIWRNYD